MTRKEAKRELRNIKEMEKDIKSVELEIERLMTVATKMTTSFSPINISGSPENKLEKALIQVEEYRKRLSNLLLESVQSKVRCLDRVNKIEPKSLRKILLLYYFQDNTLEKTAELIDKSYQWTHELMNDALDKYCEISDSLDTN